MALTGALRILRHLGYALPYWTLRADSNPPCELPHIFLTALARSAQCTGVYACCLDALVRSGVVTIMTSMLPAISISRGARDTPPLDLARYTQILNPV